MNTIFAFLLSLSTLFGSFSAAAATTDALADKTPAIAAAIEAADAALVEETNDTGSFAHSSPDGVSYADIRYEHYDPEPFYAAADRMQKLAKQGESDAVNALYDELYEEFLYIDSLSVLTMLRSDADIYDEYWSDEYVYMDDIWYACEEALFAAGEAVLNSQCADSFTEHIGQDTADAFREYEPMTEEQLDASDREIELTEDYRALYDTIDDTVFSYEGRNWTLDMLFGFPGEALSQSDYDAYLTVYYGLQEELCRTFAPIYIELIGLWREDARAAGYDSYIDYAYEYLYGRDYTAEDAQRFCDAIKPVAREYYADLYYSDMAYEAGSVAPVFSADELLDLLGAYLPRVDESLLEPWTALTENSLYDMAPVTAGRYDGAYTTMMLYYHSPFLFASLSGDCYDLITMTHEFGHFSDYWFHPQTNIFTQTDNLDLSEIHSNALQALFTAFYGEIYSSGADVAEFINLSNLLESIIDGCLYDEFQRRLFAETEALTPERINAIHTELCAEYGLYDEQDWDSTWVYIAHNFEQPLYYISYAASAMAALQIWDMAQTDYDAAVDVYLNVLGHGAHAEGYFAVLEESGLRPFREEGAVADVCRPVLDRLEALDANYAG